MGPISKTEYRMVMPYYGINSIVSGNDPHVSITISLNEAPKIYNLLHPDPDPGLAQMLELFSLENFKDATMGPKRQRVSEIPGLRPDLLSRCFVYRLRLANSSDIALLTTLSSTREVPPNYSWSTHVVQPTSSIIGDVYRLQRLLATEYNKLTFAVKFQVQRIATNGYLPPGRVTTLLPEIFQMYERSGSSITASAVNLFITKIPYPGPDTQAFKYSIGELKDLLLKSEAAGRNGSSYWAKYEEKHKHLSPIHRAIVTPTGTYLYGPSYESSNRVLRKYADYSEYFLRVSFLDETGDAIHFDRMGSNEPIFHKRFRDVLRSIINIGDREFHFLGFSHSALRAQTCWFMAPFTFRGEHLNAREVIGNLGNFAESRCPAKCAARIGQAFSETFNSVAVPNMIETKTDDVERNGRVFSDGVGTISSGVLDHIHARYGNLVGCNVFQIRYAGAKGMISLDTRLQGNVIQLRDSMIKFDGSKDLDIEICGSAIRPLPMFLNRQLIKILEDLEVHNHVFVELQQIAVEELRQGVTSNRNAASFLEQNNIAEAAQMPWLLRKLHSLDLPFQRDPFLRDTIEMAVFVRLQEIKHKSRIFVQDAVTLYGIMDETDFLKEDEIYCTFMQGNHRIELVRKVMVTRSPALHPGDIQITRAVCPPKGSPLRVLSNCVVFSQRGSRDLPSKLSGGDLDGDIFNIVWYPGLIPPRTCEAADYPRVEQMNLDRPVTVDDMTDFFVQFMENDQLGRIANLHQILADQSPLGTKDKSCLQLADMHSTAVDFSKSGVPVNMLELPKHRKCRPDFMAGGPTMQITHGVKLEDVIAEEDRSTYTPEEEEDEPPKYTYYESEKVVGTLYRSIDENAFFHELQQKSKSASGAPVHDRETIKKVWSYVKSETSTIEWEQYVDEARQVREMYEENVVHQMFNFLTNSRPLDELEVFIGCVVGKNGSQTKRQREHSIDLKKSFQNDLSFTALWIKNGESGDEEEHSLERSIACLSLSDEVRKEEEERPKVGRLRSFEWVAAAVCLKEVDKFHRLMGH